MGIGGTLSNGEPHDGRAPDYDDWALNGDILIWYPVLERAVELSSMGIRVDEEALRRQLALAGCPVLLHKAHIGEVQASIWDKETTDACAADAITLL